METKWIALLGRFSTKKQPWEGKSQTSVEDVTSWDVNGTRMPIPPDKVV